MSALAIATIQDKINELAKYDEAALKRANLKELRQLSRGVVGNTNSFKKDALVQEILKATAEARGKLGKLPFEGNTQARAEALYQRIKAASIPFTDVYGLSADIGQIFADFTYYEERNFALTSRKSNYTDVSKLIEEKLKAELTEVKPRVEIGMSIFKTMYKAWNLQNVRQANEEDRKKVIDRNKALEKIDDLLVEAKTFKAALENPSDFHWTIVARAIMFATGRRPSEVHASGQFQPVDQHTLTFSGQAKTKGREDAPENFEIPSLLPAPNVVDAIDWLAAQDRRYSSAEEYNKKGAMAHSRAAKDSGLTPKDLRCIYTDICIELFKSSSESEAAYKARILGHSDKDIDTQNTYTRFNRESFGEVISFLKSTYPMLVSHG